MQDPEFLQSVLENLPGVDPNNEAIRNAMGSLASQAGAKPDSKKEEEKKKWTSGSKRKGISTSYELYCHSLPCFLFLSWGNSLKKIQLVTKCVNGSIKWNAFCFLIVNFS